MSGRGLNPNSHIDKGLRKGRLNIAKEQSMAEKQEENLIDWCTFYRRNIHRFVEHYFGIQLHLYQKIMIYLMNTCPLVVLLCSRAVGKSWITALYCCAVCVLYPGSKVVATAKRKKTVELLIKEKIEKELMKSSPNLAREIKKISTSNNNVEVIFHNGSTFVVSPCNDDARGQRATVLIVDEFRQCDKTILDSVFSPMEIKRQPPFSMLPEYEHLKEEPREIYLSSAYYKSHWMWGLIKEAILGIYDGSSVCISMDYAVSVKV